MARTPASGKRNRRTQIVAISGALLIAGSLALPKLMHPGDDAVAETESRPRKELSDAEAELLRNRVKRPPAVVAAARPKGSTTRTTKSDGPAERVAVERVEHAADDLGVVLGLRWQSYPVGTAIQARVEIANRDETPVWIPSPEEPYRTLAIRVLDANGVTVRHVVEETEYRVPRRMRRLGPGETATLSLDVLAHGEEPLPPGRYELAAVFEADNAWLRTGLPVWTAPKGARHSGRVSFEITAK